MSGEANQIPNIDVEVEKKARDLLVENLAHAEALSDPRFKRALIDRKAAESEAENIGRLKAFDLERRHEKESVNYDEHPWGIDYLKQQHSPSAILERVRQARGQVGDKEADGEMEARRSEALEEAIAEARQLTLEMGRVTAKMLSAEGIPCDTRVITEHASSVKKFSPEELRLKGKVRSKVPVFRHENTAEGWELPIGSQISRSAKVILCKNGRILVAYGKETQEEERKTLHIKPNTGGEIEQSGLLPIINRPEPKVKPNNTYSSYLDETPESDIGVTNLPVNTPVARANMIFSREQALHEAIATLLVEHNISLSSHTGAQSNLHTSEFPTEISQEGESEKRLPNISDEEK